MIADTAAPWRTPGPATAERVQLLLSELTLTEKVGQLHFAADVDPEADRAELSDGRVGAIIYSAGAHAVSAHRHPALAETIRRGQLAARESRLGIPLLIGSDVVHGLTTTYPIPLGLAASWDTELVRQCAVQTAEDATELGLHLTFAPMVDISAERRWGRIGETFGGEPELTGRMAVATITGFQSAGRLAATAKHFCGYGLVQAEHDHETLSVGLNALHNVHLRPFRAALAAGCRAVMVGFHDVDGVPMHANRRLIRDLLKTDWGFDGVIISDWDGVGQLVHQGVATDLRDAVRQSLLAGVDLDLASGAFRRHLPELVESGEVDPALVDDAVRRVLTLKFDLGLFDPPSDRVRPPAGAPPRAESLARRMAAASMVLLKNTGILPLHPNVGVVHLCGPFVEDAEALLGSWVFAAPAVAVTPAAALGEHLRSEDVIVSDGRFSDISIQCADVADLTVAVVGEHPDRSGQDGCLPTSELPVGQLDLLRVLAAVGRPLIVVVVASRPLDLRPVLALADAVLVAWHPGSAAGPALADVLFGVRAPGGRLPVRLPRAVATTTTAGPDRRSESVGRRLGRSRDPRFGRYLDALGPPELALGFGLDYTSFSYSEIELSRTTLPLRGGVVRASVTVINTGDRPGREIVQLYIRDLVSDIVRPLIELADWQPVALEPGGSARVSFPITAELFGYTDRDLVHRVDPGEVDVIIGPNSAQGRSARLEIV